MFEASSRASDLTSMTPTFDAFCLQITAPTLESVRSLCRHLLINSDPTECNQSLSTYLKTAVDHLLKELEVYHVCSVFALDLLRLNLFTKNFGLCMGKILSLLKVLSDAASDEEVENFKSFLLVITLLTFKLHDDPVMGAAFSEHISDEQFVSTLRSLGIISVVGNVLNKHITSSKSSHAAYVLLKFNCDIIFQYLYKVVLLSDEEFDSLTRSPLIPTLIADLTSNDNFNEYDVTYNDFEDEEKLVAYEEFKLLLLINEQYLMKTISCTSRTNRVFEGLLVNRKGVNVLCGFTNLLVYHLNREESSIIKILMLKFLYTVFTTSYSAKFPYLNDVKILLDIILRELNDLDYSPEQPKENCILALTYLKVLNPLLVFSQLSELDPPYKPYEILETLRNVVINCDTSSYEREYEDVSTKSNFAAIVKSATKCLNIPWVKKSSNGFKVNSLLNSSKNASSESLVSILSVSSRVANVKLGTLDNTSSTDSLSFTRVASVRASNKDDYNLHTKSHNLELQGLRSKDSMFSINNGNVFLQDSSKDNSEDPFATFAAARTEQLLDLPKEYLGGNNNSQPNRKPDTLNARQQKAKVKRAPPPPPPPPRRRR